MVGKEGRVVVDVVDSNRHGSCDEPALHIRCLLQLLDDEVTVDVLVVEEEPREEEADGDVLHPPDGDVTLTM